MVCLSLRGGGRLFASVTSTCRYCASIKTYSDNTTLACMGRACSLRATSPNSIKLKLRHLNEHMNFAFDLLTYM